MNELIYMDNAATTEISDSVLDAMMPYLKENYGNPSSLYSLGQKSKAAIQNAREQVAKALGANEREIFFTGSGTEADNWAIRSYAMRNQKKGKHIITTKIEHPAILRVFEDLETNYGFETTFLDVNSEGMVELETLEQALRDDTILVSIMYANSEIGTINPIQEISKLLKEKDIAFHTDAVQAIGMVDIDVKELDVDMLSLSAHKIHGPKGVGALYVRSGIRLDPLIFGGGQENNRRSGTENVAGVVGLGQAIEDATVNLEKNVEYLTELRDYLIDEMLKATDNSWLNGASGDNRLAGNTNFSFEFIEGEGMLLLLDHMGIAASSGSACASKSLDPSHVLLAIGLKHEEAHGSLRLTLSTDNTKEQVDYVVESTAKVVNRLREMSPMYHDYLASQKGE